ncbi:hypothetical protein UG55_102726 [Frankia sp. EI5c]|nr:hypothetical protein UG55_102726 [Frankia sp. EI5c]
MSTKIMAAVRVRLFPADLQLPSGGWTPSRDLCLDLAVGWAEASGRQTAVARDGAAATGNAVSGDALAGRVATCADLAGAAVEGSPMTHEGTTARLAGAGSTRPFQQSGPVPDPLPA